MEVQCLGVELAGELRPLVGSCDSALGDQLRRATNSMVLNIAEATGWVGRDRKNRLRIARGEALEVHAALELARAWGYISDARAALELIDRISAMLYRLTR